MDIRSKTASYSSPSFSVLSLIQAGDAAQKEFQAAEDAAQEGIGEAAENAAGSEEQPFLTVRLRIEKMTEPVMQGYDAMYLCTVRLHPCRSSPV